MPGIAAASEAPALAVASGAWPGPPVGNTCRLHYNGAPGTCSRRRRRAAPGRRRAYHGLPLYSCSGRIHYNRRRRRTASLLVPRGAQPWLCWVGSWALARRCELRGVDVRSDGGRMRLRSLDGVLCWPVFGSAQQNRASVERHTSYFALSGRRGRVASRDHYGVSSQDASLRGTGRNGFHQTVTTRDRSRTTNTLRLAPQEGINKPPPASPARPPAGRGASPNVSGTRGSGSTHMSHRAA